MDDALIGTWDAAVERVSVLRPAVLRLVTTEMVSEYGGGAEEVAVECR